MKNLNEIITDEQSFNGAKYGRGDYAIKTYDDGFGPLWISRNTLGINGIVRAQTWEDAYGICEDEFFSEADKSIDEIVKEYGFDRKHVKVVKDATVTVSVSPCVAGERLEIFPDDYPEGKLVPQFVRWATIETPNLDGWADNELFQESYGFRENGANSTDVHKHSIYQKDLNGDYLDQLTPEIVVEMGIALDISKPM
jgi:hypothetical protein